LPELPARVAVANKGKFMTHDQLLRLVSYDPITGQFYRIKKDGEKVKLGSRLPTGHVMMRVNGGVWYAHHLAWFYVYREQVKVHHVDGNPANNAITNLRPGPRPKVHHELTHDLLLERMEYDPLTGIFFSLRKDGRKVKVGAKTPSGVIRVFVNGKTYDAHELAWFYVHNEWTTVWHLDGDRTNNAMHNLVEGVKGHKPPPEMTWDGKPCWKVGGEFYFDRADAIKAQIRLLCNPKP
jgi:hypothetical protein